MTIANTGTIPDALKKFARAILFALIISKYGKIISRLSNELQ